MRPALALLVMAALTALMGLLIAGHGPWAGEVIWAVSPQHGLNRGDLPVIGFWAVGMVGALALGLWRD